jgi:cephalosporin hydroxylase
MSIVDAFHTEYYNSGVWFHGTHWMGCPVQKCPLDLWVYQSILFETRPDFIIETGSGFGGSALFMAHVCDILGKGKIISVDIKDIPRAKHDRITYMCGSSIDPSILARLKEIVPDKALVILDSDHTKGHVQQELKLYEPFVAKGSYLIVEDTNVNGHPICSDHGPGPFEAVSEFLLLNKDFKIDLNCERFLMTQNPGGYLKRI